MSSDKFVLLGTEIKKGKGAILELDVAKLHTRNSLKVPVIVERGKKDGPVLLLLGGVHGDESNGVAIVRDIIRKKYHKPKRGTVICIPVFNVFGYLNLKRAFPDGRDLNRVFPGSSRGSLAGQFAHKFTKEIAPYVDYVVDFHTGGADRSNFPNIRCNFDEEQEYGMAKAFGAPYMMHSKYISHSIRETIHKMGKPIILFEGGKSLHLDKSVINCGVNGALNVMKHLNMHDGEVENSHESILIKKSKWLRAPYSGLFESMVENGQHVTKKTLIGRVSDPYGEFEKKIYAPFDCYIFGLNTAPNVYKGDALFHVSVDR
ncbi:succinylglutamate desuccinylase/aspartoacylase family protein [Flammeovirga sp. EKP202]|uniref:succinylglutamate desuccinylase/aspartoacylase family protein n=1 Tax=Flammeovirga sp. EKP202 TaxID=2770592 RepID=UPI00165ED347|nr:succinylglutamate desuccinylase/aspartoacylase family protein [Flammeovirga sp. EKP202]MBD0399943.1 succinylglutamate desuccinylase/aspartoacylase family protein [Flammeovirga sp. EKP202]